MSSLPPAAEVIDALLKIVLPAFVVTLFVAVCGSMMFGKRMATLTAALAVVLGMTTSNLFRGVFVLRFDADTPLTATEWGRGFFNALTVPYGHVESSESDEVAQETPSATTKSPKSGRYWIPSAVAFAVAIEILAASFRCPNRWLWLVRLIASMIAARLAVPADLSMEHAWLPWFFGFAIFLAWIISEQLSIRAPAGLASLCLIIASLAAATVLIHAHSARLTDAATMLMAASCAMVVAAWWKGVATAGASPIGAVFLPAIMISGYHETFSEVPLTAFVLPAIAPIFAGLIFVLPEALRQSNRVWFTAATCVGAPAVAAIVLATRAESLSF